MDGFYPKKKIIRVVENNQQSNLQLVAKPCDKVGTSPGCTMPLAECQLGSAPAPRKPLDKKEEEPHEIHTSEWRWGDKKPTSITCNKAQTVEALLKQSSQFREIAEKNKDKELVIVREGKAIARHFPCSLIKKKRLTVRYVKAVDKQKQSSENRGSVNPKRRGPSDKLLTFHLLTKGGKNVVNIMRNPVLKTNFQEMTVYAYKGEKVKLALKRDGRLLNTVFRKNCALSCTSTEVNTEMSNLVDDLDGKTFKIVLLNKASPPESQPGSLDDAYMVENESQRSDSDGSQDLSQQSTTAEPVNNNTPEEKPNPNGNTVPEKTQKMQRHLSTEFEDFVKRKQTKQGSELSRVQDLFRAEYGKNAQTCSEVKTLKKLMDLGNSVCQVRINGRAVGSGFLLFDKFVLTNGHVVEHILQSTGELHERVTVHFSFESLDQEGGDNSGSEVEEVAGFEYGPESDWALLRLSADQSLPDGLLTHFGFLPPSGGICIIGHPDGGVKKMDPCFIIPTDDRKQSLESHLQWVTQSFFENLAESVQHDRRVLTYESSFYCGSSGSPVFDEHCNVVAMHTGGYNYPNVKGETVIEYGYPLSIIIEHVIVQLVERGRFDVLKKYLACSYARHQNLMTSLKKVVEIRNFTAFKNAVNNSVVRNDESLKQFFVFLTLKEEPVPMDM